METSRIASQPVIAVNVGADNSMSLQALHPVLAYVKKRDAAMQKVMANTGCSRDDAKNLYIACVYGGNEYGWLRRMNIYEQELCAQVAELVSRFRKCAHRIRREAIDRCPEHLKDLFGTEDGDQLWHQILVEKEDSALQCIEACMAENACRVCQLSYDGCFWQPPEARMATWSPTDDRALEDAVNARLAALLGLMRFPLKFKIKGFQLPKVCHTIATLRARILELEQQA